MAYNKIKEAKMKILEQFKHDCQWGRIYSSFCYLARDKVYSYLIYKHGSERVISHAERIRDILDGVEKKCKGGKDG